MEIAVYDHSMYQATGKLTYHFSYKSTGITPAVEKDIIGIMPSDGGSVNSTDLCCTRFVPTSDRTGYLFSHIFHNIRSGDDRVHHASVSYVLTPDEADKLFLSSYLDLQELKQFSRDILTQQRAPKTVNWSHVTQYLESNSMKNKPMAPKSVETRLALLTGARLEKQAQFFIVPCKAEWLAWLLWFFPRRLRKNISFCFNALDVKETANVSLVFCDADACQRIPHQSGGVAVDRTIYNENANQKIFKSEAVDVFQDSEWALQYATLFANILEVDRWSDYDALTAAIGSESKEELLKVMSKEDIQHILKKAGDKDAGQWLRKIVSTSDRLPSGKRKEASELSLGDYEDSDPEPEGVSGKVSALLALGNRLRKVFCWVMVLLCLFAMFRVHPFKKGHFYGVGAGTPPTRTAQTVDTPDASQVPEEEASAAANSDASQVPGEEASAAADSDAPQVPGEEASEAAETAANSDAPEEPVTPADTSAASPDFVFYGIDGGWLNGFLMGILFTGALVFLREALRRR